jgi:nitrite reductase/ring-hydroxylating ferredoxin subunit
VLISLCQCSDIRDPGSKGFHIEEAGVTADIFVVHKDTHFYAFTNSCPHTGANLEWLEDQFLDMENTFIQCATHDALFDIETGSCVSGPCIGDHLSPIKLQIDNNQIFADIA